MEGLRNLEADVSAADDYGLAGATGGYASKRLCVIEGPKFMHPVEADSLDRGPNRVGTGGVEELVVTEPLLGVILPVPN